MEEDRFHTGADGDGSINRCYVENTSESMILAETDLQNENIMCCSGQIPTDVPNQVSFIFNNLSFANVVNHAHYMKEVLTTPDHWKWLSHYIVFKRATTEPNYHALYVQFVNLIDLNHFAESVIAESYFFIKSLLQSPLMTQSNSDKTCLKNLGHWLGMMTLARNKPILTIEIDIKMLLIEAHLKGRNYMKFVLPFVARTLEPSAQSKIFRLPNPWLMSILSILVEINSLSEMDTSFRLEIELLLKNLKITVDEIPSSSYLADIEKCRQHIADQEQLCTMSNNDFIALNVVGPAGSTAMSGMAAILMRDDQNRPGRINTIASICPISSVHDLSESQFLRPHSQPPTSGDMLSNNGSLAASSHDSTPVFEPSLGTVNGSTQGLLPSPDQKLKFSGSSVSTTGYHPKFTLLDIKSNLDIQSMSVLLDIKANIPALILHPQMRKPIAQCIFKTINEILPGLLERASKIALSTTEAIIKKDFCMCADEPLIRSCAHNMVANLVSGLVLIGGREQLFRQMIMNLTQLCCENLHRRRLLESSNGGAGSQSSNQVSSTGVLTIQQSLSSLNAHHIDEIGKDGAIQLARDNIDVCVCIMSRITMHRSMQELERRLVPTYDLIRRTQAYSDPNHLTTFISSVHNERLPESIRLKPGSPSLNLLINYQDFAKSIAAFNPLPDYTCPDMAAIEFAHYVERILAELFTLLNFSQSDHCPDRSDPHRSDTLKTMQSKIQALHDSVSDIKEAFNINVIQFATDVAEPSTKLLVQICYCFMDIYEEENLFRLSPDYISRVQECFFCIFRHCIETNIMGPAWNCKILTRAIVQCTHQFRNNLLILPIFIKFRLINLSDLDIDLRMEFRNADTISHSSLYFTINLLRYCLLECGNPTGTTSSSLCSSSGPISYNLTELHFTIDALHRCAILNPVVDEYSWNILEVIRINYDLFNVHQDQLRASGAYRPLLGLPVLYSAVAQVRSDSIRAHHNPSQLADLHERTARLFAQWVSVHRSIPGADLSGGSSHQVFASFVLQMNENGIFKADECIGGFFRGCVQVCITKAYDLFRVIERMESRSGGTTEKNKENSQNGLSSLINNCENGRFFNRNLVCQLSSISKYHELFEVCDAFVKLVVLLVKHSGDSRSFAVKISLLNKVLGLIAGCCLIDSEIHGVNFYPLPYQRMFLTLFRELCAAQFLSDSTHYLFTQSIMSAYFLLNPLVCPSFTFGWLELVGHGPFMGKVLQSTGQVKNTQCWTMYSSLLCALLRFVGPFIVSSADGDNSNDDWVAFIFKCTLRIFLILLHDFPEFLVEYAYELVEHVPPECIQLRNLILSAYPRQMKLPDPSNPILKVDLLAEININPPMYYNYHYRIQPAQFKSNLDNYLNSRTPSTFLAALRSNLTHMNGYNVKVINALVIYVGVRTIELMIRRGHHITTENIGDCAHMDIFESLLTDLDFEGRYHFLNAMLNHIRFPSCHTHFFSCAVLYLFLATDSMAAKEQITRILVERLVVHRPHPWGIRVTFTELVRNKTYRLAEYPFIYKIPQIQSLFESAILGNPYVSQHISHRIAAATSQTSGAANVVQ